MFRSRAIFVVMVALALVAAACGGGDSTSDDTTTTTVSSDGGSSSDTTTTTAEPASGDSDSNYCERVRAAQDGTDDGIDFSLFGKTPAEIEAQFKKNLEVFEEWRDLAPDAIKDDATVLVDAFRAIVDRGSELEWDFEAMADDDVFNSFDDAALTQATDNLDAYSRDVCDVDIDTLGSSSDGPPAPGNGDVGDDPIAIVLDALQLPAGLFSEDDIECIREEVGAEFEAGIAPGWVPSPDDLDTLFDAVDACGISFTP